MVKRSLMKNIVTIARCATLYQDAQMLQSGITGYQAPYISIICENPGVTQDELAQRLHVNRSSVSRQVSMLEENGFVIRKRSEYDRRAILVYPTKQMEQVLPRVCEVYASWRSQISTALSAEELDVLESLLCKLAVRAEEVADK